jgi:hypothetical protein
MYFEGMALRPLPGTKMLHQKRCNYKNNCSCNLKNLKIALFCARQPRSEHLGPPSECSGGNGTRSFEWCQPHSPKIKCWGVTCGLRSKFAISCIVIPIRVHTSVQSKWIGTAVLINLGQWHSLFRMVQFSCPKKNALVSNLRFMIGICNFTKILFYNIKHDIFYV